MFSVSLTTVIIRMVKTPNVLALSNRRAPSKETKSARRLSFGLVCSSLTCWRSCDQLRSVQRMKTILARTRSNRTHHRVVGNSTLGEKEALRKNLGRGWCGSYSRRRLCFGKRSCSAAHFCFEYNQVHEDESCKDQRDEHGNHELRLPPFTSRSFSHLAATCTRSAVRTTIGRRQLRPNYPQE